VEHGRRRTRRLDHHYGRGRTGTRPTVNHALGINGIEGRPGTRQAPMVAPARIRGAVAWFPSSSTAQLLSAAAVARRRKLAERNGAHGVLGAASWVRRRAARAHGRRRIDIFHLLQLEGRKTILEMAPGG